MDLEYQQIKSPTNHVPEISTKIDSNLTTTACKQNREDAIRIGDIIYYESNENETNECDDMAVENSPLCQKADVTEQSLEDILKELNLFGELYDFLKSRNITPDALKYMQSRHIDELFNGSNLSLKIIFEHRLKVWQNRRKQCCEEEEVSVKISHKPCHTNKCQLMSIKYSNGTTSSYHIHGLNDLTNLSNRFMELIQSALNTVLMEFTSSEDPHNLNCFEESENSNILSLETLLPSADDTHLGEKLNIISVETVTPEISQSSITGLIQTESSVPPNEKKRTDVDQSLSEWELSRNQPEDQNYTKCRPSDHIIKSNMLELSAISHNNKRKLGVETEVKEILLMYKPGNNVIKHYNDCGELTPQLRSDLIRIIVDHFILNGEFISVAQCRALAKEIVQLFPTESLDTYFTQEKPSIAPKGKLWNLYQNQKRQQKKECGSQYTRESHLKMEVVCKNLKNIKDKNYQLVKWNKTFNYRRNQLESGYFTNWKMYFDEYPFCKQENYSLFIDADLVSLYSGLSFDDDLWDDFLNNFRIFFWNKIKHQPSKERFEKLSSMDEMCTSSDYFSIQIIQLLHAVLNNTASLEDGQRQFIVEVTDLVELKEIVIDRKKNCLNNNQQCKPYIAVVRENNTYVHYSVILDSTGFGCENFKESLILCFKLYLFFDISYPAESFSVWLFIQKYFFNKSSLIVDTAVDAFIDDIRAQSKVGLEINLKNFP